MFIVKDHLAYSAACFERSERPENQDLCMSVDFDALPAPFGKGLIRIVMDGMTHGNGKEAVEAAAPPLFLNLVGELMHISRGMSRELERMSVQEGAEEELREYLARNIREVLLRGLRHANGVLRRNEVGTYCTISVCFVFYRYLFTCNMGDSPILMLDLSDPDSELEPLSCMDNQAGRLISEGKMTEEQAIGSAYSSGLLRFLGYERRDLLEDGEIHFRMTPLPESCLLLLGTDGALSQLTRREMTGLLRSGLEEGESLQQIMRQLRSRVGDTGSDDDFTLLMDLIDSD